MEATRAKSTRSLVKRSPVSCPVFDVQDSVQHRLGKQPQMNELGLHYRCGATCDSPKGARDSGGFLAPTTGNAAELKVFHFANGFLPAALQGPDDFTA